MTGVTGSTPDGPRTDIVTAKHPKLMFVTVALALFMSALDSTIVATALPALQHDLNASIARVGWTITAYALGMMLMLMLSSRLSESFGRRRVFLASVAVFAVASLLCGLSSNIYLIVLLRFVQALGGAGFTPSATGIIVDHFGSGRDKAVGLFGTIFPIGGMTGPVLGGIFVDYWSWRGIFFVNVPVCILLILLCLRFVPGDTRQPARRVKELDPIGVGLLGFGVLALMIALNLLGQGVPLYAPTFLVSAAASIAAGVIFLRHIGRHPHPILPLRFIAGRGFGPVNIINIVYNGVVNGGIVSLVPLYAVTRFRLSALASGTLLTAEAAAAIAISPLAVLALRRTGYRRPIYVGATMMALGTLGLALTPSGVPVYPWLAGSGGLIGLGAGIASPSTRNAGLQLEPSRSSSLAALRTMGGQIGAITSVSVFTALLTLSTRPGVTQAHIYLGCAILLILVMPVTSRITEHRGSW